VFADAHDRAAAATHMLNADQQICVRAAPRVAETDNVLEQLGLLLITCLRERVLVALEVERFALVLIEQRLEELYVHGLYGVAVDFNAHV